MSQKGEDAEEKDDAKEKVKKQSSSSDESQGVCKDLPAAATPTEVPCLI
jgi:hypothetical protein